MTNTEIIISIGLLVTLSCVCIGFSIFILMKVGESKNPLLESIEDDKKNSGKNEQSDEKMGLKSMLDKNNKLLATWNQTEKAQHQLKMLQAAGEAEQE